MSAKSILMLVGEFSEEYEIFVFQQAFEAVGHPVGQVRFYWPEVGGDPMNNGELGTAGAQVVPHIHGAGSVAIDIHVEPLPAPVARLGQSRVGVGARCPAQDIGVRPLLVAGLSAGSRGPNQSQ